MRRAEIFFAVLCAFAGAACADDKVLSATIQTVDVRLFIPREAKVVRGLLVHSAHYKLSTTDRWAETCRAWHWAHMAENIDLKQTNRPAKLRRAMEESLVRFAEESGYRELLNVPRAGVGHSAGGMVTPVLLESPDRTITTCVSCGWITDPAKLKPEAALLPLAFTLGAIPDDFKMLPGIEDYFVPARKQGLPWGLAVQWGCAHDWGNSLCFFMPWIEGVTRLRVPSDWDPLSVPPVLRQVRQEQGWLGDRASTEGTWAIVASWDEFKGDKSVATWFPDRRTAFCWRALMTKDSPVHIEAAASDGSARLPAFNPKVDRGIMVDPGISLILTVSMRPDTNIAAVEYYDGDVLLGASAAPPWQFTWKDMSAGPHVIWALWKDPDGKPHATNPAWIVRRHTAAQAAGERQ